MINRYADTSIVSSGINQFNHQRHLRKLRELQNTPSATRLRQETRKVSSLVHQHTQQRKRKPIPYSDFHNTFEQERENSALVERILDIHKRKQTKYNDQARISITNWSNSDLQMKKKQLQLKLGHKAKLDASQVFTPSTATPNPKIDGSQVFTPTTAGLQESKSSRSIFVSQQLTEPVGQTSNIKSRPATSVIRPQSTTSNQVQQMSMDQINRQYSLNFGSRVNEQKRITSANTALVSRLKSSKTSGYGVQKDHERRIDKLKAMIALNQKFERNNYFLKSGSSSSKRMVVTPTTFKPSTTVSSHDYQQDMVRSMSKTSQDLRIRNADHKFVLDGHLLKKSWRNSVAKQEVKREKAQSQQPRKEQNLSVNRSYASSTQLLGEMSPFQVGYRQYERIHRHQPNRSNDKLMNFNDVSIFQN